jgi:hypothetical protein
MNLVSMILNDYQPAGAGLWRRVYLFDKGARRVTLIRDGKGRLVRTEREVKHAEVRS